MLLIHYSPSKYPRTKYSSFYYCIKKLLYQNNLTSFFNLEIFFEYYLLRKLAFFIFKKFNIFSNSTKKHL
ncbi:hypothetical protein BpHYR1_031679 [Brachionus plicatilis]|uniref:Uncharacterized protein n=1 Tax=Brachionus plicatilis TaxID=10195 RepID=A0A3M7PS49_BRAPC|nr:hypothetical protein BpHYR1_031679 [Brachionus plicatilis]